MHIAPSVRQFVRAMLGKTHLKRYDTDCILQTVAGLRFSINSMRVMAEALCDPLRQPPATFTRECDYYDHCPFRVPTVVQRMHLPESSKVRRHLQRHGLIKRT